MSRRSLWRRVLATARRLRVGARRMGPRAQYARYLRRCQATGEPALDPGSYFARRVEERYNAAGRCC